jgi:hypothetical protein
MYELEFIPTDDLLEELMSRYNCAFFVGNKLLEEYEDGNGLGVNNYKFEGTGPVFALIGLVELAKHHLVANHIERVEDD